jgi:hypothetical protein
MDINISKRNFPFLSISQNPHCLMSLKNNQKTMMRKSRANSSNCSTNSWWMMGIIRNNTMSTIIHNRLTSSSQSRCL